MYWTGKVENDAPRLQRMLNNWKPNTKPAQENMGMDSGIELRGRSTVNLAIIEAVSRYTLTKKAQRFAELNGIPLH